MVNLSGFKENSFNNIVIASWAYLQLMRPANIVTAWADILAGFAAAGAVNQEASLGWLLLATSGLYGGGVVFNDVFDAKLDAKERPERPIPSQRVTKFGATLLGSLLLVGGVLAALPVSALSAVIAMAVAFAALLYNRYSKHHPLIGPVNMGLCRGGNLLLGISAGPAMVSELWFLALIPIVYIAAITTISRGEVYGGTSRAGKIALLLFAFVLSGLLALGLLPNYITFAGLPFLLLLAGLVLPPLIRATYDPSPAAIQTAVKAGVLSLIVLDATVASGFTSWLYGLLVLSLLPLSLVLARKFAVT